MTAPERLTAPADTRPPTSAPDTQHAPAAAAGTFTGSGHGTGWMQRLARRLGLRDDDLLRDRVYRRLWLSTLVSSLGGQVTLLALPLTGAVLLNATPSQMGLLTAMELLPFALLSLPAGVWLDRVRKLPVYLGGHVLMALMLLTVPAMWALGWLAMGYLYLVAFVIGSVAVVSGSAAQVVLIQIVPRPRLVEAHARNALASSGAEVVGPGLAGALIRLAGAPVALLADAVMILLSVTLLRGLRVNEPDPGRVHEPFVAALRTGLRFVMGHRLLVTLAIVVGGWELFAQGALVMQILVATRELGLDERQVGLCYVGVGVGTITASSLGHRISQAIGPGPCLILGAALSGAGWLLLALVPAGPWGIAAFVTTLTLFGAGAVLLFINFLALRQSVTPQALLGRMTSTMRWAIIAPGVPGAMLGGWVGDHLGLRWALGLGGGGIVLLALAAWAFSGLRAMRELPVLPESGA